MFLRKHQEPKKINFPFTYMFESLQNVFLRIAPKVILTKKTDECAVKLEAYFREAKHYAWVTSALRDSFNQLSLVREYMILHGLDKKYPNAMTCGLHDKVGSQYVWQMPWSELLNRGIVINPPLEAVVLMDYYGPTGTGSNKKGSTIGLTPHHTGMCLDIGGRNRGTPTQDNTIKDELPIIARAYADKVFRSFLPEHGNNAIHINC